MSDKPAEPLKSLKIEDDHGWKLSLEGLYQMSEPRFRPADILIESPDKRFACLFYSIEEVRNGYYLGYVAFYEDKNKPRLLSSSFPRAFSPFARRRFIGDYIALDDPLGRGPTGTRFLIACPKDGTFGFFEVEYSSDYYDLNPVGGTLAKLARNERITHIQGEMTPAQEIDLRKLQKFPLQELAHSAL